MWLLFIIPIGGIAGGAYLVSRSDDGIGCMGALVLLGVSCTLLAVIADMVFNPTALQTPVIAQVSQSQSVEAQVPGPVTVNTISSHSEWFASNKAFREYLKASGYETPEYYSQLFNTGDTFSAVDEATVSRAMDNSLDTEPYRAVYHEYPEAAGHNVVTIKPHLVFGANGTVSGTYQVFITPNGQTSKGTGKLIGTGPILSVQVEGAQPGTPSTQRATSVTFGPTTWK